MGGQFFSATVIDLPNDVGSALFAQAKHSDTTRPKCASKECAIIWNDCRSNKLHCSVPAADLGWVSLAHSCTAGPC